MMIDLPTGAATGIGSLPHTDPVQAAEFVLSTLPDLPAIPTRPRAVPAERMLAQVAHAIRGVRIADDGSLEVQAGRVDPRAAIVPDLDHAAWSSLRVFCDVAAGRTGHVKWQVAGPLTLGVALTDRGLPPETAFDVAVRAVRLTIRAVYRYVAEKLPHCDQVVFVDEPAFVRALHAGFPLTPDTAIDITSGGLAAVEVVGPAGLHCCSTPDVTALLAAGPQVLSVPVGPHVAEAAGAIARFLEAGGWVAWGAVPTNAPFGGTPDRYWRELSALWCELVQGGCDAGRLRRQAIVTPACGLADHSGRVAGRVLAAVTELAAKTASQAVATKLSLGA
jgi:hypothetical protein